MPDLLILCILPAQTLANFLLPMQGPDRYSYLDTESKSVGSLPDWYRSH